MENQMLQKIAEDAFQDELEKISKITLEDIHSKAKKYGKKSAILTGAGIVGIAGLSGIQKMRQKKKKFNESMKNFKNKYGPNYLDNAWENAPPLGMKYKE